MNKINTLSNIPIIAVCGASVITEEIYALVVELGKELAQAGFMVACGGLFGTMEAICKGAKMGGGITIGILPSGNRAEANKYVDIPIATRLGEARNAILTSTADAVVIISGGSGTLSEIAFAWKYNKPIIAFTKTGGWAEKITNTAIDDTRNDIIYGANSPHEVISKLKELLKKN
jgi:uncharacterized protein (TIGR00725 family)